MDIFNAFATDEHKELHGTWMPFGDMSLLIARAGNRAYVKMLGKEVQENQKALDLNDEAAEALSDQIMTKVAAGTILLGWKNLQYQGAELEYSKENAETVLAHRDFRREVFKLSEDVNAFKLKKQAEDVKN